MDPRHGPVFLDDPLIASFLAHSEGKGNTGAWIRRQQAHLRVLQRGLAGEDLRTLELGRLLPLVTGDAHRIAILKALYAWLRKTEHRLTAAEDPTFGVLSVPQRTLGLIRSGGHFRRGGYGVQHGRGEEAT